MDKKILTGAQIRLTKGCFENKTVPDGFRIPEGTRRISVNAFRNAVLPEGFTLPDTVTEIDPYAFDNAVLPESFQLPPLLTTIGLQAFWHAKFKKLNIPKYFGCYRDGNDSEHRYSIMDLGVARCEKISVDPGNFYYDSRNDCNAVIEKKTNTLLIGSASTVIPDSVTTIHVSAFSSGMWPAHLNLPASITDVEFFRDAVAPYCFLFSRSDIKNTVLGRNTVTVDPENPVFDSRNNCNAVIETKTNKLLIGCPSTVIPSDTEEIGGSSFAFLTLPDDFTIPESVKRISGSSFMGVRIKRLFIPKSVTDISEFAFSNAEIGEIAVDPENPKYDSRDNCNAIIDKKANTVIAISSSAVIPEGVTNNILPYEVPKDYYVNHNYDDVIDLMRVHAYQDGFMIPKDCTYNYDWKKSVFRGSFIPDGKASYLTFKNSIFEGDFNYPKDLKMYDNMFEGSVFRGNVTIPSAVKKLTFNCFAKAQLQAGLKLPKGLNAIDDGAFMNALLPEDFVLPEGTKKIGHSAFLNSSISEIVIPAKVEQIGTFAFACTDCRNISVSPVNPVYNSGNNCDAIIETATGKLVAGWHNTVIPDTVKTIGTGSFYNVTLDDGFIIPEGVTRIEKNAFQNAVFPENFVIPASVEIIDSGAFRDAIFRNGLTFKDKTHELSSLTFDSAIIYGKLALPGNVCSFYLEDLYLPDEDIILPDGVKKIGVSSLSNVTAKKVFIPKTAEEISVASFTGSRIESIVIDPENPRYDSRNNCNAVMETATNALVDGCKNTVIPENCEKILQAAFDGITLQKNFRIPESVKEIEHGAFQGAILCENFVFPGIETLQYWTFRDAIIPKGFRISEGVKTMEFGAFENVIFPEGFQLPASCKDYGKKVFYNAAFQKDFNVPSDLVEGTLVGARKLN